MFPFLSLVHVRVYMSRDDLLSVCLLFSSRLFPATSVLCVSLLGRSFAWFFTNKRQTYIFDAQFYRYDVERIVKFPPRQSYYLRQRATRVSMVRSSSGRDYCQHFDERVYFFSLFWSVSRRSSIRVFSIPSTLSSSSPWH
jgi:hypothetical protein